MGYGSHDEDEYRHVPDYDVWVLFHYVFREPRPGLVHTRQGHHHGAAHPPPIILHVIDSPETLRELHQLPLSLQQNEYLPEQPGEREAYFDPPPLAIHCCRTMLCEVCTF